MYDQIEWTLSYANYFEVGCYIMEFMHSSPSVEFDVYIPFTTTMTASDIKSLLYSNVYYPFYGSDIIVTVTHLDATG